MREFGVFYIQTFENHLGKKIIILEKKKIFLFPPPPKKERKEKRKRQRKGIFSKNTQNSLMGDFMKCAPSVMLYFMKNSFSDISRKCILPNMIGVVTIGKFYVSSIKVGHHGCHGNRKVVPSQPLVVFSR